ncbi:hypothetical protein U8C32_28040 (plasmid) [Sinorhizobium medicae]|uniref:hypothetical protein n=1 Tax=Sinorhizobium medicae TaxID=110321 RepID=UPI002AF6CB95|nr:hypothetical protein [Sinorhizobium medicae]WQO76151.1 hypothetical protein U8C31_29110 [Sinorhizobium medicae]WQO95318.1 hypothetical protein U8C32_28040 [Sinorhizobium medicae]
MVSFVLVDVSSIKINRASALLKKRLRRLIHNSRARAISGRRCSLARSFFLAQSEPMEKATDIGAMHDDAASGEFYVQLVQRRLAILCQVLSHPIAMRIQRFVLRPRRLALSVPECFA